MGNGTSGPEGIWPATGPMKKGGPRASGALADGEGGGRGGGGVNGKQPRRSKGASAFDGMQGNPAILLASRRGQGPGQSPKPGPKRPTLQTRRFITAASSIAIGNRMKDAGLSNNDGAGPARTSGAGSPFAGAASPPAPNNLVGFRNNTTFNSSNSNSPARAPFGATIKHMRMSVGADGVDDGGTVQYSLDSESPPPLLPLDHRRGSMDNSTLPRIGSNNKNKNNNPHSHRKGPFLPAQAATEVAAETEAAARAAADVRAKEELAATAAVTLKEKTYDGFKVPRVNHYSTVEEACTFLGCDLADLEYADVSEDVMEGSDGRWWMVQCLTLEQQQQHGADYDPLAPSELNFDDDYANGQSPSPPPPQLEVSKGRGLWRLRPVGSVEPGVSMAADRCRDGRVELPHNAVVDFITDIEGQWAYFEKLVTRSEILSWDEWGELDLKEHGYLVHGGDAADKGCGDIQVVKALVGLKQRYPDRVFLILGNRDVNKMRFTSELAPGRDGALVDVFWDARHVPFAKWLEIGKRPTSKRMQTLQWILECTMGCQTTFETRRTELALLEQLHIEAAHGIDSNDASTTTADYNGRGGSGGSGGGIGGGSGGGNGVVDPASITDEAVYDSFISSVDPSPDAKDPWMLRYLELGQVALVLGDTLFVHGAINKAALQFVPGWSAPAPGGVLGWVTTLNNWVVSELERYKSTRGVYNPSGVRAGEQMMAYFLPLPPTHPMAGKTCIYNDGFVKRGKYVDPHPAVSAACNAAGVTRIMVGHLPRGQCPAFILNGMRTLLVVMADTSYSDMAASKESNPANNRGVAHALVSLTATTTRVTGLISDGSVHSALMQYPSNRRSVSKSSSTPSSLGDLDGLAMELGLELTEESADTCVGLELVDGSRVKTVLRSGVDTGKLIVAVDERTSGENCFSSTELNFKPRISKGATPASHAGARTPGAGSERSFKNNRDDPHFSARADELSAMLATAFDGIWGPGATGGSRNGNVNGNVGGSGSGNDTPNSSSSINGAGLTNGAGTVAATANTAAAYGVGDGAGAGGKAKKRTSNGKASPKWSQIRDKHTNVEWREMLQSTALDLQYDFGHTSEEAAADVRAHKAALAAAASPLDGTLAAAQHHILSNLIAKLRPLPIANAKFSTALTRFLAARGYHIDRAESAVRAHVAWRESTFPIRSSEFAADPFFRNSGIFQFGRDMNGRPIIVLKGSSFCPKERGAALCERGVIYVIESLVAQFQSIDRNNSSQFSIIFDLDGYATSKHLDRELIKRIFSLLSNHYPQRLHHIYFSPCSWKFKLAGWPLLRSCMDSQSRSVALLLKSKSELLKYVSPEQLEESFGGTSTFLPRPFDLNAESPPVGVASPW